MSSVKISEIGDNVKLFLLDMPGKNANVLTDEVYNDLDLALSEVEAEPPRGIVLATGKPSIFVAGADLGKISSNIDWPDEAIFQFCDHGRKIMSRFSEMEECVSVAAIHGVCVGGGLELPLWCDCRIASENRRTLLGLPEVKLGLIPGWAGTVRLPRLIGFEPAVDLAMSGDLVTAAEAMELGLVSLVAPEEMLIQAALQVIDREHYTEGFLKRREEMKGHVRRKKPKSLKQFRAAAKESIQANQDAGCSAATILTEHMLNTMKVPAEEAMLSESRAFADVWGSEENRGLLHYFFVDERAKKIRPNFDGEPPRIETVGIVGAGWMGSEIARLAAGAGFQLRIYDADERCTQKLTEEIIQQYGGQATGIASLEELAGCDLVIECIVEKLKIKQSLFERICDVVAEDTLLATNTSTIPVSDIASAVTHPERLVGLHFCWPVDPVKLVEIIRSEATDDKTLNVAIGLVRKFRKTPVVVADRPGFVVNRMLCPVIDAALGMLQMGIAPERIDQLVREFGFTVGILEMIDFIGVDTIMYSGETFLRSFPDLISLTPILPVLVKRGWLGRKAGKGFYRYDAIDGPPIPDPEVAELLKQYEKEPQTLTDEEILARVLDPMARESQRIVEDGVVQDIRDVDLCSVLGTTFPRKRGGVLFWSETINRNGSEA